MTLRQVFHLLLRSYGPQHWWPGDSPFEVMVGAILTQNTAWSNVEKAIHNLRVNDALSPAAISATTPAVLADWIRPSGYFNVKALRLHNFCRWYLDAGGFAALQRLDSVTLRQRLLAVNGVGPETADDMLLYAFERPVFVIDAYTRRLLVRLGLVQGEESYDELRHAVEQQLGATRRQVALFNEFHALIVVHAKVSCRKTPLCRGCCLLRYCAHGLGMVETTRGR